VIERLRGYALVTSVEHDDRVRCTLADGMRCELLLAPQARFGWAWIEATGSREHVAQLRARGAPVDGAEEADVYRSLGVPFVPPEVRDGGDDLGADFSALVTLADVTTAFHCHTTYSDGKATIAEMVRAAAERGFDAITITDHSAAATYASGLDAAQLRAQLAEIDAMAAPDAQILRGTEADILADGAIDVPPELIGELDVIIASVHQRYHLDREAMTARLVTAMRQPFFKIWGHALGRMVMRRDPIDLRLDDVLDAIAESPAAIEINGDPHRLDLDPVHARDAARRGIKFVLSCDAHSTRGIDAVRFAVAMARRARIRRRDVLNALPPEQLMEAIRPTR
jgi:DNA polymerase (family 10)